MSLHRASLPRAHVVNGPCSGSDHVDSRLDAPQLPRRGPGRVLPTCAIRHQARATSAQTISTFVGHALAVSAADNGSAAVASRAAKSGNVRTRHVLLTLSRHLCTGELVQLNIGT